LRSIKPPPKDLILDLAGRYSFAKAAALLGVHERTFAKWYHKALPGREHRSGPRPIPAPTKEELLAFLQTHTNQETADSFGVGYKTLARWLRQYNVVDRLFDQDEMISLADAARQVNVSRMTLSNWFRAGLIPGACKINGTRVMVPATSMAKIKLIASARRR
jgi:transposase-like protein